MALINYFVSRVKLPLPKGARVCTGIAFVTNQGTLQFCSTNFEGWMLTKLGLWVEANVSQVPGLAYLKDSVFLKVNTDGDILARIEDPEVWEDIPQVNRPGSLQESESKLKALRSGEEAWVWLSVQKETPIVAISNFTDDAEGSLFAEMVINTPLVFNC